MKSVVTFLISCLAVGTAHADAIETFRKLCLNNLGNPAAVAAAGKKAGFSMIPMGGDQHMGLRAATDESLQVNVATRHKFECAITTSDMSDPSAVSAKFFQSLGLTGKNGKAAGKINGKTYTFLHDTKGGEAFVVYTDQ